MWERVGLGESSDRIDWELVIQAANVCDQLVPIPTASYQKRYTCNFTFYADQQRGQIKEMLQDAMLGRCIESGGKWRMWAGAALLPDVKLTEANLQGSIQLQASSPSKERYNRVRGKFVDPSRNYAASAYPERRNSDYETADNGFKYKTIDFNTANTSFESQRGAEIRLRQSRQQKVMTFEGNWSCFRLQPGTVVLLDIAELEFEDKKFFITEYKLRKDGAGVDLTLVEEDDTVWEDLTEADYTVRSPTGELIFAGQENLEVKLTGGNLHNSRTDATCSAGVRLNADGTVQYMTPAGAWTAATVPTGEWLGTGGRDYWVRCTVNSGTLDVGTTSSWLSLDTDRLFNEVQATAGVDTANITLEIAADSSGSEVLATAVFDISATYVESPAIQLVGVGSWQVNSGDIPKPSGYASGDDLLIFGYGAGYDMLDDSDWDLIDNNSGRRLFHRVADGTSADDAGLITSPNHGGYQMAAFRCDGGNLSLLASGTTVSGTNDEMPFLGIAAGAVSETLVVLCSGKIGGTSGVSPSLSSVDNGMTTIGTVANDRETPSAQTAWLGWAYEFQDSPSTVAGGDWDVEPTPESGNNVAQMYRLEIV
jgi:hypothetical protein